MVATCTSDAQAFLYDQTVNFRFERTPNYVDLFILNDIHLTRKFYLIQKTGHMITFGIMYCFHLMWMKSFGSAFVCTGIVAAFSEVLQLYFNRSGRLFDIGVDLVGIFLAYFICKSFFNRYFDAYSN